MDDSGHTRVTQDEKNLLSNLIMSHSLLLSSLFAMLYTFTIFIIFTISSKCVCIYQFYISFSWEKVLRYFFAVSVETKFDVTHTVPAVLG